MSKERNYNPDSPKYKKVRDSLPNELQPIFDQLVDEYAYNALKIYGRNWVAYDVLGNLIREGWRPLSRYESEARDDKEGL